MKVLVRPGRVAEPPVGGDVEDDGGPLPGRDDGGGEDGLVADEGGGWRQARDLKDRARRCAGAVGTTAGDLAQPDGVQDAPQRQELAEGDEVDLVIEGQQ